MDRKRAPDAFVLDAGREDRIVGRVIDAVGEPGQDRRCDQGCIRQEDPQQGEGETAKAEPADQKLSRAKPIDKRSDRSLGQPRDDAHGGQGEPELNKADTELVLEEGKQGRQHQDVEVAHPMRRGDARQGRKLRTCGRWLGSLGNICSHSPFPPRCAVPSPARFSPTTSGRWCRCPRRPRAPGLRQLRMSTFSPAMP